MKRPPAAPLRRLAPLTVLVLLAHLALLRLDPDSMVQPGAQAPRSFNTRVLAPPPAAAVAAAPGPPAAKPPQRAARPDTAPRPRPPVNAPAAGTPAPAPEPAEETPQTLSDTESGGPALRPLPPAPPAPDPALAGATPGGPVQGLPQVVALPVPARMHYEVTASRFGVPLQGQAELRWRHDGQQYEVQLELRSSLFPSRTERSVGRITDEGLAPSYYSQKSRGEQATHFERDKGRLTFSNNRPAAPLVAGMQDRLSVVVQLAVLIGGEPARFPPGTQIAIPTASTREAETWIFSVEGEEDLDLPGGTMRGLKLQRKPRKEFDQKVELWLAPRMDYAPVRLRLTNPNGDTVDQRWSSTDKG